VKISPKGQLFQSNNLLNSTTPITNNITLSYDTNFRYLCGYGLTNTTESFTLDTVDIKPVTITVTYNQPIPTFSSITYNGVGSSSIGASTQANTFIINGNNFGPSALNLDAINDNIPAGSLSFSCNSVTATSITCSYQSGLPPIGYGSQPIVFTPKICGYTFTQSISFVFAAPVINSTAVTSTCIVLTGQNFGPARTFSSTNGDEVLLINSSNGSVTPLTVLANNHTGMEISITGISTVNQYLNVSIGFQITIVNLPQPSTTTIPPSTSPTTISTSSIQTTKISSNSNSKTIIIAVIASIVGFCILI